MKNLIIALLIVVSNPSLAVMIGSESRTRINSPTDKEAKRVGLLEMWDNNFGDNRSYCTASNISKRHIVTAAHCVINLKTGRKYDHIIYYPRHVDTLTRSPSRIFIRKAFVLDKFLKEAELKNGKGLADNMTFSAIKNDIAVLEAFSDYEQKYAGTLYGWFGTKPAPPNTQYIGAPISLKSYPGDKEIGTLWSENCKLRSDFSGFAITTCDTFKGASGSAIVWNSPDHKFGQVVGVYSADDEKTKTNAVALFTKEISDEILNIIYDENHLNKLFMRVDINTEKFYYFHVQNKCRKPINVAIRLQNPDETWSTYEYFDIQKNQRSISTPPSNNSIYYYHARTTDDSIYWADDNGVRRYAFGKSRPFYKKQVPSKNNTVKWGDYYRQVSCD